MFVTLNMIADRMRICCDVDVVNRLLPSFNMKKKGKSSRAQLSVGRKPGADGNTGEVFLMMCTKLDRNGAKYQVITVRRDGHAVECRAVNRGDGGSTPHAAISKLGQFCSSHIACVFRKIH